ncbi:MAG: ATP-dependent DNA helicase RecG [Gammaproteobacteria bacterium]|nr:ATP-dependent DNA helicase RecG [Gammaproteobacteria bacterium]
MSEPVIQQTQSTLPVAELKGVGPRTAEHLARLNIVTVQDLLFHLPLRYQDRTRVLPIGSLRPGDEGVIEGIIELTEIKFARRRMLLSRISDGTGAIYLRFFHFSNSQKANLQRGKRIRCFGEVRRGGVGLEIAHPEYQLLNDDATVPVSETLTPVYPVTEGLHQRGLLGLMHQALEFLRTDKLTLDELVPAEVFNKSDVPTLKESILFIHQPPPDTDIEKLINGSHIMYQRLIFEELLAHYLSLRRLRTQMHRHKAPVLNSDELSRLYVQKLPFSLTSAQSKVAEQIKKDVQQGIPMQRLIQGDVGSGKTVVAVIAALMAVEQGYQAAIMAPTEILAEQHFRNIEHWLQALNINVAWLSGKLKAAVRRNTMAEIVSGKAQVIVGTHALFQDDVEFNNLAMVIIDEQHRFGVHQRLALREKGKMKDQFPHQLIMTATPIPRTLSMAAYADLDCSVIDELPPGRKPVETVVIPESRRNDVVQRVHQACIEHKQVYWVCTLIEESEVLQCQAAEETASVLQEALPDVHIGLVHGRMKSEQKEKAMQAFKQGEIDLLVATTVIEVGVDVPNASLMIIENAERLGLSQLHQLRGRVGRGDQASACVLMYRGNLSDNARIRLGVMRDTNDGFEIARKDLELRGPGEVLGTRQTGLLQLKVADLQRDQALLPRVAEVADVLLNKQASSVKAIIARWKGEAVRYGQV